MRWCRFALINLSIAASFCMVQSALAATSNAAGNTTVKTADNAVHQQPDYVDLPQQQLAYLYLPQGVVVLQLADAFTPQTTARFRQLVRSRFYDGLPFYRVIDQFVLQAGAGAEEPKTAAGTAKAIAEHLDEKAVHYAGLAAEFSWPVRPVDRYHLIQKPDLLAAETGFNQGFAVGREQGTEWLLHCPNVVVMARGSEPNSAATDFAIMQGQAPRHLDKNMAIFGRVIWGQQWLNQVQRGDAAQGGMLDNKHSSKILKLRLGTELPKAEQLMLQQQNPASAAFATALSNRRQKIADFYVDKGNGQLDICYQALSVRIKPAN